MVPFPRPGVHVTPAVPIRPRRRHRLTLLPALAASLVTLATVSGPMSSPATAATAHRAVGEGTFLAGGGTVVYGFTFDVTGAPDDSASGTWSFGNVDREPDTADITCLARSDDNVHPVAAIGGRFTSGERAGEYFAQFLIDGGPDPADDLISGILILGDAGPVSDCARYLNGLPGSTPLDTGSIVLTDTVIGPPAEVCDNGSDDDGDGDIDAADLDCPPAISAEGAGQPEGDVGTTPLRIALHLSHPSSDQVEVTCELEDNAATYPADFTPRTQIATIPPGETDGECIVDIVGDKVDESSENFDVHLVDPVNAVVVQVGRVVGTIINDDDPRIRIDNAPDVTEGDSGTTEIHFPLTLSNPSVNQPAAVTCVAHDIGATYPADYRPASVRVTIPPGDITAECVFESVGDTEVETGGQTFSVDLQDFDRSQAWSDEAYASIIDDDTDEPPPVDDTVPPVVVAVPDRDPNGRGWYRDPVVIDWQATDPDPSSGTPSDPPDTTVSVEGQDMEVESGQSCDPAGNCATGVTTLSIDMTRPVVSPLPIEGLLEADGQYPVIETGTDLTLRAEATDALSGVTLVEYFVDDDPGRSDAIEMDPGDGHYSAHVSGLTAGAHRIRIRARDAAGNWSTLETLHIRATRIANADGCSLLQDDSEQDNAIQLFEEQGEDTALLCKALPVDIESGAFGPGANASRSAGLAPGTIPAGTRVRSFLVHVDRAYLISVNGDYVRRTIVLDFEGGTVLGAAVRDNTLRKTDVLAAPGTRLQPGLEYRGHEVNLRLNGSILNTDDALAIRADRQRVTITLQVGEAMDEVRIITTAGASLASSSTGFQLVDPPRSLRQDDFDTEHCPQSPPNQANCTGGPTGDDVAVLWEQQVHPVRLDKALKVDLRGDLASHRDTDWTRDNWSSRPAADPIPAGTRIRSVILHVDREGDFDSFADGDFAYVVGTKTFSREILGVIASDALLDDSDILGASGRLLPTGYTDRALDFHLSGSQYANKELIRISGDQHTITVRSHIANGMDEVRVILGQ